MAGAGKAVGLQLQAASEVSAAPRQRVEPVVAAQHVQILSGHVTLPEERPSLAGGVASQIEDDHRVAGAAALDEEVARLDRVCGSA